MDLEQCWNELAAKNQAFKSRKTLLEVFLGTYLEVLKKIPNSVPLAVDNNLTLTLFGRKFRLAAYPDLHADRFRVAIQEQDPANSEIWATRHTAHINGEGILSYGDERLGQIGHFRTVGELVFGWLVGIINSPSNAPFDL